MKSMTMVGQASRLFETAGATVPPVSGSIQIITLLIWGLVSQSLLLASNFVLRISSFFFVLLVLLQNSFHLIFEGQFLLLQGL